MKPKSAPHALLRRRLRALQRMLPAALAGDVNGVHKARVASRRVRETLPVALVEVSPKKLRRARRGVRRITRALGPVRELDVTLALIADVSGRHPEWVDVLDRLRRDLEGERQYRREEMRGRMDPDTVGSLLDGLHRRATPAAAEAGGGDSGSRAVLAVRVIRRARQLQAAVAEAGPLYAPDALHAVRISLKKLRYAVELAHDLRLVPSAGPLRQLKAVQETLGSARDLQLLADRIGAAQGDLASTALHDGDRVEDLVTQLEDRCRELHAKYVSRRSRLLAAVDAVLEAVTAVPVHSVETAPATSSVH